MEQKQKRAGLRLLAVLLLMLVCVTSFVLPTTATRAVGGEEYVYVGGMPFGVRYVTDGIMVVGYCDITTGTGVKNPAKEAGVRPGDCILSVNGNAPKSAKELSEMIKENGSKALRLTLHRDGTEKVITVSPVVCQSDGMARTGLWVRDTGAGLGTVTFIKSDRRTFAGLGHGICDGETALLVPILRGSVLDVTIGSITRGSAGAPGELKGHFAAGKTGVLQGNTPCGVYGSFIEEQQSLGEPLPIGKPCDLVEGDAVLRTTLDDNTVGEYRIKISDIHKNATGNKCFTVTVTDKALLQKTGGIVQGMSGSPIIQNGKLVGAVTHVLIGDPTTGYGIFVTNMLANIPQAAG
ncbi:MAG: SpoIVB peptidase [Clostridia bacterium]|nr:SpoIVB peptidase [Clostridia bacterium]